MPRSNASLAATLCFLASATAAAAEPATIVVSGVGRVLTPPDVAKASLDIRGEGRTADEATAALVKTLSSVRDGVSASPGVEVAWTASEMNVAAVRGEDCGDRYGSSQKLSTGDCAIKGYIGTLELKMEVSPPEQVGTLLGLAARLGADAANVAEFDLKDRSIAERQAAALALADAEKKARVIAEGSGRRLGPLTNVTDSMVIAMDLPMPAGAKAAAPAPPQLKAREPIAVALQPELVATNVQLAVTYAVEP